MTRAVHIAYRTTPTSVEDVAVVTDRPGATGKPPLIYCHQHATTVDYMIANPSYAQLFYTLAEDFTVAVPLLGYTPGQDRWGNATWRQRLNEVITMLADDYGATQKFTLVGASMGAGGILSYVNNAYGSVASVAVALPLISLRDLRLYNSGQYATVIDNAYGGAYSDATYGAEYSPEVIGANYPDSAIPTAFWTATDDAVTRPVFSNAFVAANPTIRNTSVGATGHTEAGIFAATPGIIEHVRRHKP